MHIALPRPGALFLDFGGVLTEVHHRDEGFTDIAKEIGELLVRCRAELAPERIESDVREGSRAFEAWKRSQSRAAEPREPSHRGFWARFVTADWPAPARAAVEAHASELCERFEAATVVRPAQDGARELLVGVAELGLPTALICNTLSGNGTRRLVREHGFAGLLSIELYSDEQRLRKPNPAIFTLALEALDVSPDQVWYVGDKLDRDVLAARRAGLGAAILMTSNDTTDQAATGLAPDVVLASPRELLGLVRAHASEPD